METLEILKTIDDMGGMIKATEKGYPQSEIANSAYIFQQLFEKKDKVMVGVNKYTMVESKRTVQTLYIDRKVEDDQKKRLADLRKRRNQKAWADSLDKLVKAAAAGENLMEPTMNAVKAYATVEEICNSLKQVYGIYREAGSF